MSAISRIAATAAILALASFPAAAHDGHAHETVTAGNLMITFAWSRATPPGAGTAAGYMTITNDGSEADRLIRVESPFAAIDEVHEMTMTDDRMVMRPLDDGLAIPAGETVTLQPGGYHLMFIELEEPLIESTVVEVTLVFEVAGEVMVPLDVYPIGSPGPAAGASEMDMNEMDHGMSEGGELPMEEVLP